MTWGNNAATRELLRHPLRRVTERGNGFDVMECGHTIADPYKNGSWRHHCPQCPPDGPARPTIVCLCGSTRFGHAFRDANLSETLAGNIVLTVGCDFHSDQALGLTEADKERLDELHKRKIDLADEVLILNVGGYIGVYMRSELEYARAHRKRVRFLEEEMA